MKKTIFLTLLAIPVLVACRKSPSGNTNSNPSATSQEDLAPRPEATWQTLSDGSSFANYTNLEAHWNYNYPWGVDHNGSARMVGSPTNHSYVYLNGDGSLTIKATRQPSSFGNTGAPHNQTLWYYSGTIHSKHQVNISATYPNWEISGDFKAPTVKGSWPAFWCTGADSWPPESDFMEVKGNTSIWQNTYDGGWETTLTTVGNAATVWHNYKVVFNRIKNANGSWSNNVKCLYYIDNVLKATHTGSNFANKNMNIIINMQMEGSSGSPGPGGSTYYHAKNIVIRRGTP